MTNMIYSEIKSVLFGEMTLSQVSDETNDFLKFSNLELAPMEGPNHKNIKDIDLFFEVITFGDCADALTDSSLDICDFFVTEKISEIIDSYISDYDSEDIDEAIYMAYNNDDFSFFSANEKELLEHEFDVIRKTLDSYSYFLEEVEIKLDEIKSLLINYLNTL